MAVLPILTYPNPLLKKVSQIVDPQDSSLQELVRDLFETLDASPNCTGIAAPQIGVLKRIIAIDASRNAKAGANHGRLALVNPVINFQSGEAIAREGCLSIPDFTGNVKRATNIKFKAITPDGKVLEAETTDFEARLILHEVDHLDGIIFLDRVASLKTHIFRRKRARDYES